MGSSDGPTWRVNDVGGEAAPTQSLPRSLGLDPVATQVVAPPAVDGSVERLGRYLVSGHLGQGGMGEVLAIYDADLGREVAAKRILGRPEARQIAGFVREARITGQLQHPSIVPAYELGRTSAGELYLTMKKVAGSDLSAVIERIARRRKRERATRRGALPTGLLELLQIMLKVCDGVGFAHSHGVIHRDLKPANVMVGEFGEVLVLDWGLAKLLDRPSGADPDDDLGVTIDRGGSTSSPLRTLDGAVVGTPAYMPPEQADGQISALDQRADVYALGAMLYEVLALQPPFSGPNAWAVLAQVTDGPPPPPSERVDGAWAVPWELEACAARAMSMAPEDRYPSVAALRADIEAFLEGRALATVDYSGAQRAGRFLRRHWRSLSAAAAVLAAVIGALVVALVVTERERAAVARERDNAQTQEQLARQHEQDAKTQAEQARKSAAEARTSAAEARKSAAEARRQQALTRQLGALQPLRSLEQRAAQALWWTPLARADGELTGELALPPSAARFTTAAEEIDRWRAEAERELFARLPALRERRAELADEPDAAWRAIQQELYDELIEGAEALQRSQLPALTRRQTTYRKLAKEPHARGWEALAARMRASARYRAPIAAQVALEPLGPDPASGLEEFGHLGSGRRVRRGASGQLELEADSAIVFVLIPAGRYRIGASPTSQHHRDPAAHADEGPDHLIELGAYFIAKHELTQAQWVALGGSNKSRYRPGMRVPVAGGEAVVTARHPLDSVSWTDAVRQLAIHGLQLPSEAQWEAAARANRSTPWWTGAESGSLVGAENLADALTRRYTQRGDPIRIDDWVLHAPVGSMRPNPFGLHDALGNVCEWCSDLRRQGDYRVQAKGPEGRRPIPAGLLKLAIHRVWRGGSWDLGSRTARASARSGGAPGVVHEALGLRAARQVVQER